jgi:hypothetical protein
MTPLADPALWRKLHNPWISEIYQALKPQVAGRLSLSIDQEITLIEPDGELQRVRADLHLTEADDVMREPGAQPSHHSGAVAYAEGVEPWSSDSRHLLVLRDLSGGVVVALLEILSPTNKGVYARADFEAFLERRHRLLSGSLAYLEIDAVPSGTRWLPRCIESELTSYHGVAWSSLPDAAGRRFQGWAWADEGPLARIPWDLGQHGLLDVDLDATFHEALRATGLESTPA